MEGGGTALELGGRSSLLRQLLVDGGYIVVGLLLEIRKTRFPVQLTTNYSRPQRCQ